MIPKLLCAGSLVIKCLSLGIILSATKAALESCLVEGRALRKTKTTVFAQLLPEPNRKPRKKLTPDELEARNKKVSYNQLDILKHIFTKKVCSEEAICLMNTMEIYFNHCFLIETRNHSQKSKRS